MAKWRAATRESDESFWRFEAIADAVWLRPTGYLRHAAYSHKIGSSHIRTLEAHAIPYYRRLYPGHDRRRRRSPAPR